MLVKELKKYLNECNDDSQIVIFALTEDNKYRPFRNITCNIYNKSAFNEELHLDINIFSEYKSIHFPNNPSEETVMFLNDKKQILLEELEDLEEEIKELWKVED